MSGRWFRNSFIYLLILVAVIAIVFSLFQPGGDSDKRDFSQVIDDAKQGRIQEIEVDGNSLKVHLNDSTTYDSRKEDGQSLIETLQNEGISPEDIPISVSEPSRFGNWFGIMINFLPLIIFGGLLIFMMRQAQGSNSQAMSFGKSKARVFTGNRQTVSFLDVAGVDEAKEELQEVVEFLKYPEKFAALGARIPSGVLLVGPPGTGKTLLARAVAGEAGVPFFSISGSEFVEMFVGVGASRVRDLFEQAKRNAPCIVFVDEIDAVGRQRGAGLGGSHDEREQTLNQILVEMDGFDTNTNVIVVAATNRPDILDPALLRPGRFDRRVVLDAPDVRGRRAILDVHIKGKPLETDIELDILAKETPGFSGADLANLVNEAAILAARRNKKKVSMPEFSEAVDRIVMGPERKSRIITEKEKRVKAYHEAGHALVASKLPEFDPVQKVTIVARGISAGGFTMALPEDESNSRLPTRTYLEKNLAYAMGGRAAEEVVFEEMTTGASSDIEQATSRARAMVTRWGMSERLGPRTFGKKEELVFLGREISEQRDYSEKVAEEIDEEVRRIIEKAYQTAKKICAEHRDKLDKIADRLIEEETLEGKALRALLLDDDEAVEDPAEAEPQAPPDAQEQTGPTRRVPKIPPKPGLAWGSGTTISDNPS
ncbi:MAG: ATP-dependent zinc metalloprotease FtsH [Dehalococcoidia bacterium]|nr:ATP-dependent zinc metalloprotease FtsH [Dehalococcoidia bacterium]